MGCAKDSANWEAVSKSVLRGTEKALSSWHGCHSSTGEQWPLRRASAQRIRPRLLAGNDKGGAKTSFRLQVIPAPGAIDLWKAGNVSSQIGPID